MCSSTPEAVRVVKATTQVPPQASIADPDLSLIAEVTTTTYLLFSVRKPSVIPERIFVVGSRTICDSPVLPPGPWTKKSVLLTLARSIAPVSGTVTLG
ncbi:MAG: hypothetical protein ACYDGR_09340 [Candidatus Dormibacteria bacterium]